MLNLIAYAVRAVFQVADPSYPQLRCVESSHLLKHVLMQLGFPARVMRGEFRLDKQLPNSPEEPAEGLALTYAHNWVEVNDTVVDITGDQFNDALRHPWAPVYIGPRSDRYLDGVEEDSTEWLDDTLPQAVLFELRSQLRGWVPAEAPVGGLGAEDFLWWATRDPASKERFLARLDTLGGKVRELLTDMGFHGVGQIPSDEALAWMTWAPPEFGNKSAHHSRPHVTLDVKPQGLVLHLNLELARNADHFVALVKKDAGAVLAQAVALGCGLELQIYQRREIGPKNWKLERPAFYPLSELTSEQLLQAVHLAEAWGRQEETRLAYFLSQRIPAARAIALGNKLPPELARRIERLRPGLHFFDWKQGAK